MDPRIPIHKNKSWIRNIGMKNVTGTAPDGPEGRKHGHNVVLAEVLVHGRHVDPVVVGRLLLDLIDAVLGLRHLAGPAHLDAGLAIKKPTQKNPKKTHLNQELMHILGE
jgi:hypothetical protein